MIVTLFVSSSNGNANKPGPAVRQVRLQHVKAAAPTPAIPATATAPAVPATTPVGPNDGLFDNPSSGDINLNFAGLNSATKIFFEEGAEYIVTIEKVPAAS
jgi:hypothetical protein